MRRLLVRLYPARWRTRYGDEFESILAERGLGPFEVVDVILGAIDARRHPRRLGLDAGPPSWVPDVRHGGAAAALGGAMWATGFAWSSVDPAETDPGLVLTLLGTVGILLALTGLSAAQARRHPVLVWAAFALPALGAVLSIVGLLVMSVGPGPMPVTGLGGWELLALGVLGTIIGSIPFAIVSYRTDGLPRPAVLGLAAGSVLSLASIAVAVGIGPLLEPVAIAAFLAFPAGWIALGLGVARDAGRSGPLPVR